MKLRPVMCKRAHIIVTVSSDLNRIGFLSSLHSPFTSLGEKFVSWPTWDNSRGMALTSSALKQLYFHLSRVTVTSSCEPSLINHKTSVLGKAHTSSCPHADSRHTTRGWAYSPLMHRWVHSVCLSAHCIVTNLKSKNIIHLVILCNAIPEMKF